MPWSVDARVPVRFGTLETAADDAALLIEGDGPVVPDRPVACFSAGAAVGHPVGCACCAARSPGAQVLARLFLARARGETAMFREVVVVAGSAGRVAVRAAVENDPLASAWFRVEG
jgi:hypothetical protein